MAYFANRDVNRIYIHAALQAFATYGGETFAFVYLLKAGIPAPVVLLAIAAMFGSRMLFRTLVLPLVRRVGLRRALVLAILAEAATYPILSQITGAGPLLMIYLGLWAFSSSFYWTTYHSYVALLGDNHAHGHGHRRTRRDGPFVDRLQPHRGLRHRRHRHGDVHPARAGRA